MNGLEAAPRARTNPRDQSIPPSEDELIVLGWQMIIRSTSDCQSKVVKLVVLAPRFQGARESSTSVNQCA
jgi:hypothetical protein